MTSLSLDFSLVCVVAEVGCLTTYKVLWMPSNENSLQNNHWRAIPSVSSARRCVQQNHVPINHVKISSSAQGTRKHKSEHRPRLAIEILNSSRACYRTVSPFSVSFSSSCRGIRKSDIIACCATWLSCAVDRGLISRGSRIGVGQPLFSSEVIRWRSSRVHLSCFEGMRTTSVTLLS